MLTYVNTIKLKMVKLLVDFIAFIVRNYGMFNDHGAPNEAFDEILLNFSVFVTNTQSHQTNSIMHIYVICLPICIAYIFILYI